MSEMDHKETTYLVDKILERYSQAANDLLTSEFERVNEKLGALTTQVQKQNGSVRGLREWRAKHEEESKAIKEKIAVLTGAKAARVDIALRYVTVFLMFVSITAAIYFGNQNLKIREKDKDRQEEGE